MIRLPVRIKGGPGSGHWAHAGRPGRVGGSVPSAMALSIRTGATALERQARARGHAEGAPPLGVLYQPPTTTADYKRILDSNALIRDRRESDLPGAFESYKVHIEGDDDGILKPRPEEYMLTAFSGAEVTPEREVLAYEVAQVMGLEEFVPVTVMREDEDASLQQWIDDCDTLWGSRNKATEISEEQMRRLALLDTVIGNSDRHAYNVIISKDNRVYAIDHGLAFRGDTDWRRYSRTRALLVWRDARERWGDIFPSNILTEGERSALRGFLGAHRLHETIRAQLGNIALDASLTRTLRLLDAGAFAG